MCLGDFGVAAFENSDEDRQVEEICVTLLSLYAPQSFWSVSAMTSPRDAAAVQVFPPAVPLITIVLGVALHRFWPLTASFGVSPPVRYATGGAIIVASILVLGLYSVVLMRRSGQSENPWKPTTRVLERGPFRFTRNPMYLQMVLVCIGFAVLLANVWILILTPLCIWALQTFAIVAEEQYLEQKFGDEYRDYKRRVRRWL